MPAERQSGLASCSASCRQASERFKHDGPSFSRELFSKQAPIAISILIPSRM